MKVKEPDLLWDAFIVPENYRIGPEFGISILVEQNSPVQKREV